MHEELLDTVDAAIGALTQEMASQQALAMRAQMFKKAGAFHDLVHRG